MAEMTNQWVSWPIGDSEPLQPTKGLISDSMDDTSRKFARTLRGTSLDTRLDVRDPEFM